MPGILALASGSEVAIYLRAHLEKQTSEQTKGDGQLAEFFKFTISKGQNYTEPKIAYA